MVAVAAVLVRKQDSKATVPWFIFLFVVASVLRSFVPAGAAIYPALVLAAKAGLAVTLFLIGAGLSQENLQSVGWRPFALGIALWIVVSVVSLWVVQHYG